ncbi:Protein TAR1 [Glycine soja]
MGNHRRPALERGCRARQGSSVPSTIAMMASHEHINSRAWATIAESRRSMSPEVDRGRPALTVPHPGQGHIADPIRFPPDNFKHSLTLFSKSFSSFPRGTCSLSVSRQYLALGQNLPPDWGCIPKQPDSPTAPRGAAGSRSTAQGALTYSAPFRGT